MDHSANAATLDRIASTAAELTSLQDMMAPDREATCAASDRLETLWNEFGSVPPATSLEALATLAPVARALSAIANEEGASKNPSPIAEAAYQKLADAFLVLARNMPEADRATIASIADQHFPIEVGERLRGAVQTGQH